MVIGSAILALALTAQAAEAKEAVAPAPDVTVRDLLQGVKVIEPPDPEDPKENYPASAVPIPPRGSCIDDPEFGTRICRVSDAAELGLEGAGIVPMYSGTPAWNADESLLLLYAQRSGHHVFEGKPPYRYIGPLGVASGEPETVYWDVEDPYRIRWVDKPLKRLMTKRLEGAGTTPEVVHDFTDICGTMANKLPLLVETHHWQSFDGRYWGFKCDPGDGNKRLLLYDLETDRIVWNLPYTGSSTRGIWGAPMPSPTGRFVVTRQDALEVRDRETGKILRVIPPDHFAYNHMTMGLGLDDKGRHDIYVTLENEGGHDENTSLVAVNLETGARGNYIAQALGYPYPPSGIHHSMISYRQANYVWTSIIGSQSEVDPRQTDGQTLLGSEILVTNLLDGRVGRVAHHRSRRGLNPVYNEKFSDYWQEPHISVSPTGCRAVFGSDWSAGPRPATPFQPKVDTYVVELPCFDRKSE